jgi:hypothetical protein
MKFVIFSFLIFYMKVVFHRTNKNFFITLIFNFLFTNLLYFYSLFEFLFISFKSFIPTFNTVGFISYLHFKVKNNLKNVSENLMFIYDLLFYILKFLNILFFCFFSIFCIFNILPVLLSIYSKLFFFNLLIFSYNIKIRVYRNPLFIIENFDTRPW